MGNTYVLSWTSQGLDVIKLAVINRPSASMGCCCVLGQRGPQDAGDEGETLQQGLTCVSQLCESTTLPEHYGSVWNTVIDI